MKYGQKIKMAKYCFNAALDTLRLKVNQIKIESIVELKTICKREVCYWVTNMALDPWGVTSK